MVRTRADTAGSDAKKSSPVRAQWEALKRLHPGRILLFQLGDFYETFDDDAKTLSTVCDVVLTSRDFGRDEEQWRAWWTNHRKEIVGGDDPPPPAPTRKRGKKVASR